MLYSVKEHLFPNAALNLLISHNIRAELLFFTCLDFDSTETVSLTLNLLPNYTMNANENQIPLELMQPDISSQIKQTTLEELIKWINDGELQPHHQVRVKNLTWIEARKFPALLPFFESKTNDQTDQSNHFFSSSSPQIPASEQIKPEINKAALSTVEDSIKSESKPVEPSAVYKAFEKKALAKSNPAKRKTGTTQPKLKLEKKSSVIKQTIGFLAGCVLVFLLAFGGSSLWVYQLKAPVEIDEKSLPELAGLEHKITSEKLDLRLKEAAKEANEQENISQRIVQLEKKYDTQRKTAVENHRKKLEDADFTATFSFSSVALLALFLMGRIFYGKSSKPVEQKLPSKPSAKKSPELADNAETGAEDIEDIISENSERGESSVENNAPPAKVSPAESSTQTEDSGEISDSDENGISEESTSDKCLLHQDKLSVSVCEACDSRFCDECFKSFGASENSCPYCKAACKSVAANTNKASAKEVKKTNLLDLGKDSDFIVYEYEEERSRVAGVIQALVIALFISAAVSILWVYKVSPYLENRKQETAQNSSPKESKNPEQANNNSAETAANTDATDDKPCIDPETRQPFECDAETRRALFEHTRKTESVENAKKQVDEKTKLLTGSASEDSSTENAERKAAQAKQSGIEKRQLITVFVISFVVIFGILLSIIFFGKDKKTFLAQDDPAES